MFQNNYEKSRNSKNLVNVQESLRTNLFNNSQSENDHGVYRVENEDIRVVIFEKSLCPESTSNIQNQKLVDEECSTNADHKFCISSDGTYPKGNDVTCRPRPIKGKDIFL